jgi:hypothetical protein
MHEPATALMIELLAWVSSRPRTYAEAMETWRSNCPRHPVWDDACIGGLVQVASDGHTMDESAVTLTSRGRSLLAGAASHVDRG